MNSTIKPVPRLLATVFEIIEQFSGSSKTSSVRAGDIIGCRALVQRRLMSYAEATSQACKALIKSPQLSAWRNECGCQ